jgi:hypothetical protein
VDLLGGAWELAGFPLIQTMESVIKYLMNGAGCGIPREEDLNREMLAQIYVARDRRTSHRELPP